MSKMGFEPDKRLRKKYGNVPQDAIVDGKVVRFRSKLEKMWANHLEFLKRAGEIIAWEYECNCFEFDNIGVEKWLIDFTVLRSSDGFLEYHECKGRVEKRDIDKLKLLSCEYPEAEVTYVFRYTPKLSVKKKNQLERYCKRIITNAGTMCKKEPVLFEGE